MLRLILAILFAFTFFNVLDAVNYEPMRFYGIYRINPAYFPKYSLRYGAPFYKSRKHSQPLAYIIQNNYLQTIYQRPRSYEKPIHSQPSN